MEPPHVTFQQPAPFHPNIDGEGRICLDILRGPPAGAWKPTISLLSLLEAIKLLLMEPNPSDPLCTEAAADYQYDRETFWRKARDRLRIPSENKENVLSDRTKLIEEAEEMPLLRLSKRPPPTESTPSESASPILAPAPKTTIEAAPDDEPRPLSLKKKKNN